MKVIIPMAAVLLVFLFTGLAPCSSSENALPSARGYGNGGDMDALELHTGEEQITAFLQDGKNLVLDLLPGEVIREAQVQGLVGAVATSARVLAVGNSSSSWAALPLLPGEQTAEVSLSDALALFVTAERALFFDGIVNRFATFALPVGQRITARRMSPRAAVAVTAEQAAGYAAGLASVVPIAFTPGEVLRDIDGTAGMIEVVTSRRILLFREETGAWSEQLRPLDERGI